MRDIFIKILFMSLTIFIIIFLLFLFVDNKMDNVYLKSKNEELNNKVSDLNNELKSVQDTYAELLASLIEKNKINFEDITSALPPKEIRRIKKNLIEDK